MGGVNLIGFVENNAITYVDPFGLSCLEGRIRVRDRRLVFTNVKLEQERLQAKEDTEKFMKAMDNATDAIDALNTAKDVVGSVCKSVGELAEDKGVGFVQTSMENPQEDAKMETMRRYVDVIQDTQKQFDQFGSRSIYMRVTYDKCVCETTLLGGKKNVWKPQSPYFYGPIRVEIKTWSEEGKGLWSEEELGEENIKSFSQREKWIIGIGAVRALEKIAGQSESPLDHEALRAWRREDFRIEAPKNQ